MQVHSSILSSIILMATLDKLCNPHICVQSRSSIQKMAMRKDVLISLLSVNGVMSAWKEEWVAIPQNIYTTLIFNLKNKSIF